ncbi:MAG: hypothetical protein K8R23_01640 [Chthoniobacter sp.]|nr:hypothetical protein [Chthoniobacter sp.]
MKLRPLLDRIKHMGKPQFPFAARHVEYSTIASADDNPGQPDKFLFDLALKSVQRAREISMASVSARMTSTPHYPDVWPGEHYKLLGGILDELQPMTVVEIGTFTGLSALAMCEHLPAGAQLSTFDIFPWQSISGTCLKSEDFASGALKQIIGDVGDPNVMDQHAELFRQADVFFVDGPKDGVFEHKFLENLSRVAFTKAPLMIFDDIRVWNMLAIWRGIQKPKLDLTSFGHWSGTGLVHWMA